MLSEAAHAELKLPVKKFRGRRAQWCHRRAQRAGLGLLLREGTLCRSRSSATLHVDVLPVKQTSIGHALEAIIVDNREGVLSAFEHLRQIAPGSVPAAAR